MTQERLLEGWDDIGLTLRRAPEIDRYEDDQCGHQDD